MIAQHKMETATDGGRIAADNARLLKQLLNCPDGMELLMDLIAQHRQARADWDRLLGPTT